MAINTAPITVSIVEDNPEFMDFLVDTLSDSGDFVVQGRYRNGEEAVHFLPRSESTIVIVDIKLPGNINGIECVRRVKALRPDIEFMMFTLLNDNDSLFSSLKAGASGYLEKTTEEHEIIDAVQELSTGGSPMSREIARKITNFFFEDKDDNGFQDLGLLSPRENEVLQLLDAGKSYKEISNDLDIVLGTVKQHIHNIYQKLHVSNRTQALNEYRRLLS